jgi:L-amino acid N-acyltransferase YncA
MSYRLEPMTEIHRVPVMDVYNYYIENTFAAYPETPVGYEFYDRLLQTTRGYPAVVATSGRGEVVGFSFLHPYHFVSTLWKTAEVTYFILPQHTRKGLGKTMLDHLAEEARKIGVDRLLAGISSLNEESLRFHGKYGFRECGKLQDAGRKFGRDFDVVWMQRQV